MAKHSNVYYIYKDSGFQAVADATGFKNSYGLDLFRFNHYLYEGRSGFRLCPTDEADRFTSKIAAMGGVEKFNEIIAAQIAKTGESPRYTRPEERKQDIFPPDPEKENTILATDPSSGKHYYYRFYNENGIELFTLKNDTSAYRSVYTPCEGYMLNVCQYQQLDSVLKWLTGLENGIKGEVIRVFNESMEAPEKWADLGFAVVLGRVAEAEAHNAPIREAREREHHRWKAEREAKRAAAEQAYNEAYENAIRAAETAVLSEKTVTNIDINDKSLIMQLFRKYKISVPLKTQGWIISSLMDIYYVESKGKWSYHYTGNDSTVFRDYLPRLIAAVKGSYSEKEGN